MLTQREIQFCHSSVLTRSLREPGGPCTKSMEVSESRMERVNIFRCIHARILLGFPTGEVKRLELGRHTDKENNHDDVDTDIS